MMITKEQCRAGRGLLGWSAKMLAERSHIAVMTVSRFEAGHGTTHAATRAALQQTLEAAGIEFIEQNGGGPGVRLRDRL